MTEPTTGSDALLARMMTLHPKIIDLTLDRVWRLLAALDHPERHLPPVVHIAGTNGKGSTLAMIRAGFEGAGARCHAYTSPHLVRFHERIRLAGTLISERDLNDLLDRCLAANGPDPITYFEITTVAALLGFAETPADWCLLEVGLGGRLDATNVIDRPAATVITPVDLDHQQFLGDTLPEIAAEKAGILKPGVPAIIGRQAPEAREVICARAEAVGAPLWLHGQDWMARQEHGRLVYEDRTGLRDLPLPALAGGHQIDNAGCAVALLRCLGASDAALEAAPRDAVWPARMQRLQGAAWDAAWPAGELWLDGGHNPAAGAALAATLATLPPRDTVLICGMLTTKDAAGFLRPLRDAGTRLWAIPVPGADAGAKPDELAATARSLGFDARPVRDLRAALRAAAAEAAGARVVICGSLYLAGSVLRQGDPDAASA